MRLSIRGFPEFRYRSDFFTLPTLVSLRTRIFANFANVFFRDFRGFSGKRALVALSKEGKM